LLPALLAGGLFLLVRYTDFDERVSSFFYDPTQHAFPLRHSWLLQQVLHDWARVAIFGFAMLIVIYVAIMFFDATAGKLRKALIFAVISMMVTSTAIAIIKYESNIYCPYDLTEYGGNAPHLSILRTFATDIDAPGRCWPSGHASVGFCLFAMFFAARWLESRWAAPAFWLAVALGILFTVSQTARGAHFISHGLWTGIFMWFGNILLAKLLLQPAVDQEEP